MLKQKSYKTNNNAIKNKGSRYIDDKRIPHNTKKVLYEQGIQKVKERERRNLKRRMMHENI